MSTQIELDGDLILRELAQAARDEYVEAATLALKTGLEPSRINDAAAHLVDQGLAEWLQTMGTAPYDFGDITITPRGRLQVQRLKASETSRGGSRDSLRTASSPLGIKLFISHSSADAELASHLVELVRNALSLPASAIRCTSVDGYRLPGGADTNEQLRAEVHDAEAFIGIVSTRSMRSTYVLFELGARWGSGRHLIPVLAPGTPSSVMEGPATGINALRADNAAQLHQLVHELGDALQIRPGSPAAYQAVIERLLTLRGSSSSEPPTNADRILGLQAEVERLSTPRFSAEARRIAEDRYRRLTREQKVAIRYLLVVGNVSDRQALEYLRSKGLAINHGSIFSALMESAIVQRVVVERQYGEHVTGYTGPYTLNPAFREALAALVENDVESLS